MSAVGTSAWDAVAARLVQHGVDRAFGLPADDMAVLAAFDKHGIAVHLVKDQRNAAYQAVAYSRVAGALGVCFLGKGPAVTHAASGILEAQATRAPVLTLTSGVPLEALGSRAFQELDATEVLRPISAWVRRVASPATLLRDVDEAVVAATRGARGAACLDVPEGLVVPDSAPDRPGPDALGLPAETPGAVVEVASALDSARRPVLLVGGGCHGPGVGRLVQELAERAGAAVLCTASGRGAVGEDSEQFLGLSGLYQRPAATELLAESDVLVAFGTRLEETATYGWPTALPPVVQVNISHEEISSRWHGQAVVADVESVLRGWLRALDAAPDDDNARQEWRARVARARRQVTAGVRPDAAPGVDAPPRVRDLLAVLDEVVPHERVSVHENGLQDMWSYFFPEWSVRTGATCVVPSEQTPLGAGVAGIPGAVAAAGTRPVVAIAGDGAFVMASAELESLAELTHPVVVVVLANGGYGWLEVNRRQAAPQLTGDRHRFVRPGRPVAGLCAAYGIPHVPCARADQLAGAVRSAWAQSATGRLVVLEVAVALRDAPPGMAELAGDFPAAPPPQEAAQEGVPA